jgi:hypothetical protein
MPERLPGCRVVGDEVAAAVVAEQQAAGGAEQSHETTGAAAGSIANARDHFTCPVL